MASVVLSRVARSLLAGRSLEPSVSSLAGTPTSAAPSLLGKVKAWTSSKDERHWEEGSEGLATRTAQLADPGAVDSSREAVELAAVSAYYTARHIDFRKLCESRLFAKLPQTLQSDRLIINITPLASKLPSVNLSPKIVAREDGKGPARYSTEDILCGRYLVAFRYGSVVFMNADDAALKKICLRAIRQYSTSPFVTPRTEDYKMAIQPSLEDWSLLEQDQIRLRALDIHNISLIGSVLGQSVALDHYNVKADKLLEVFTQFNQEMEGTGNFTMSRKRMFQLVAENNITMTDAITKLGLLERADVVAWRYAHYGRIWEDLRHEFELEDRFERLSTKLELVQKNIKYFLDVLQNRKSNTLEWIIIVLILGEILVCLFDIYDRKGGAQGVLGTKRGEEGEE